MKDIKSIIPNEAKLQEYKERAEKMTLRDFLEMSVEPCGDCKGFGNCHQSVKGHYGVVEDTTSGLQIVVKSCNKKYGYSKSYGVDLNNFQDVHGKQNVIDLFNLNTSKKNNKGMFLYGPNTVGKTYLMGNLADRTRKQGKSIIFISWVQLCKVLFQAMEEKNFGYTMSKFEEVDVLFIDDLGAGGMSKFKINDVLFNILDYRKKANLQNFITCNYSPTKLQDELIKIDGDEFTGKRIVARIKQMCAWVEVVKNDATIIIQYDT